MKLEISENELLLLVYGLGSWANGLPVSTPADRDHPARAQDLAMRLLDMYHAHRNPLPVPLESDGVRR
jgi:hypothetical protein